MKRAPVSARDRRAFTIGVAILGPALLFVWGVKPYLAKMSAWRAQVTDERAMLARERTTIATARRYPGLQHSADSAMTAMTPRLFQGRDDAIAGGELVTFVSDLARTNNVALQTAAGKPATTDVDGVRTLHVDIKGESDLSGVLSFLDAIEHGDKLLRVDKIDISRAATKSDIEGVEPLSVSASISGFGIREGPPPSEPAKRTVPPTPARGAR